MPTNIIYRVKCWGLKMKEFVMALINSGVRKTTCTRATPRATSRNKLNPTKPLVASIVAQSLWNQTLDPPLPMIGESDTLDHRIGLDHALIGRANPLVRLKGSFFNDDMVFSMRDEAVSLRYGTAN